MVHNISWLLSETLESLLRNLDPRIVGNLQTGLLKYGNRILNRCGVGDNQWQLTSLQLLIVHLPKFF